MAKITVDNLASEVSKILDEYGDDVKKNLDEVTQRVCKAGAQAIKNEARSKFKGKKYASSWTYQVEETRFSTIGTIYSRMPYLPHLLEKGHALRGGGRVDGRPHIKSVEEEVVKKFEDGVKRMI